MNDQQNNPFFLLGFRIGLLSASVSFALLFLIFLVHLRWYEALKLSLFAGIVIHTVTYFTVKKVLRKRIDRLQYELLNISEKHFEEPNEPIIKRKDELDDIIVDIVKASQNIEKELQRLEQLETYRKDFIGDISHELKTPIFAIQGFIETLLDGALNDERVNRDFLRKAMRNVNRLIILTQNLMEIAKLETGELKPELHVLPLKDLVIEVIESLQIKAKADNMTIHLHDFDRDVHVIADRNHLRQVITNLIENGLKYNHPGGSVAIQVKPYTRNPSKYLVSVSDTGIGIEKQFIERVTQRFFRIDKSRAREKGGTGLGLSIVKHILESHNEQLFIESEPGKGSIFSFTIQNADRVSA